MLLKTVKSFGNPIVPVIPSVRLLELGLMNPPLVLPRDRLGLALYHLGFELPVRVSHHHLTYRRPKGLPLPERVLVAQGV